MTNRGNKVKITYCAAFGIIVFAGQLVVENKFLNEKN